MNAEMFRGLLGALSDEGVQFILTGGLAGIVHGAARATFDVDVVYKRSPEDHDGSQLSRSSDTTVKPCSLA